MRPARDAGLYHPVLFGRGKLDDIFTDTFVSDFYRLLSEVPIKDLLPGGKARDFVDSPERYEIDGGYGHNWMSGYSDHRFPGPLMARLMSQGFIQVRMEPLHGWPTYVYVLSPALKFLLFATAARTAAAEVERAGLPASAKGKVFPYTVLKEAHKAGQRPLSKGDSRPTWRAEVGGLLPSAGPEHRIEDLLKFRRAHEDERRRLMRSIERFSHTLRDAYPEPADALAEVRDELASAVTDFGKAARARRLSLVPRSMTMAVAVGASAAGHYLAPGLDWLLGGVAAGLAVNIATGWSRAQPAASPLDVAYLHRLDKRIR